jgi:predicted nucleotide-binding protein
VAFFSFLRPSKSEADNEAKIPLALTTSRSVATEKLEQSAAAAEKLCGELQRRASRKPNLDERLTAKIEAWHQNVLELLALLFTTLKVRSDYVSKVGTGTPYPAMGVSDARDYVEERLAHLRALIARLDLYDEPTETRRRGPIDRPAGSSVFLVHGHDHELKKAVVQMLSELGLDVTVLHEQADLGRTIIEKFEDHSDVAYAVVLLTGDDVGRSDSKGSKLRPRARQNVVLELGYFLGALGRSRVTALTVGEVEVPSDLAGILFLEVDAGGAWRRRLASEMHGSGMPVDLSRLT